MYGIREHVYQFILTVLKIDIGYSTAIVTIPTVGIYSRGYSIFFFIDVHILFISIINLPFAN